MPRELFCAALALVLLSGCAQEPEAAVTGSTAAHASAMASEDTGSIQGLAMDDEQRPIPGAEVALTPGNLLAQTDEQGRFSFAGLAPGTYALSAARLGYESFARSIEVLFGQVSHVNLTLVAIKFSEPHIDVRILDGFIKYGNAASDILTSGNQYGCEKCRFNFSLDGSDVEAVLLEPFFRPSAPQPPTEPMRLGFQGGFQGQLCVGGAVYTVPPGTEGYWASREKIQADPERCKWRSEKAAFYLTSYCDWDWVCVDQRFQVFVSLFHSMQAGEGYTALPPE